MVTIHRQQKYTYAFIIMLFAVTAQVHPARAGFFDFLKLFNYNTSSTTQDVLGARTESNWDRVSSYLKTNCLGGCNVLINGINRYLNFGSSSGSGGYGMRDNAGVLECKNSGGSWSACQDGGGSGSGSNWSLDTTYNALSLTPSTTIPVWLKDTLYASSTAIFDGDVSASYFTATSTAATSTFANGIDVINDGCVAEEIGRASCRERV